MPIYSKAEDNQRMMDNSNRECQAANEEAQQSNQTFDMASWSKEDADNFTSENVRRQSQKATQLWKLISRDD